MNSLIARLAEKVEFRTFERGEEVLASIIEDVQVFDCPTEVNVLHPPMGTDAEDLYPFRQDAASVGVWAVTPYAENEDIPSLVYARVFGVGYVAINNGKTMHQVATISWR